MTEILNTWKEIAAYLKVSVDYAKSLAKKNKDFPISKIGARVFSTRRTIEEWVNLKAVNRKEDAGEGCVYFIKSENNLIKIGCTGNIKKRLAMLRAQSPTSLELLGFIEGPEANEAKLHKKFKDSRHHGEWFEITDNLLKYIKGNIIDG